MMKKLVTILAVLLTAAVVNGAEETKSKSWDFTGSMVDFKATFPDPKTRTVKIGKEEDFIIQLQK